MFEVRFYKNANGVEPVKDWLKNELSTVDRHAIGKDLAILQRGFPVGMPLVRPMGRGLFELRSHISDKRISRIFFCTHENQLVLLHGFVKKTQTTPQQDLRLAETRRKDL